LLCRCTSITHYSLFSPPCACVSSAFLVLLLVPSLLWAPCLLAGGWRAPSAVLFSSIPYLLYLLSPLNRATSITLLLPPECGRHPGLHAFSRPLYYKFAGIDCSPFPIRLLLFGTIH